MQTVNDELKPDSDLSKAKSNGDDFPERMESPIEDVRSHRYECAGCGYIYDPSEGIKKFNINKKILK